MSGKSLWVLMLTTVYVLGVPLYGDTNVLMNPGFESGTSGWTAQSCSIEAVSSPVRSGSSSARVYNRTAGWNGIQQNILGLISDGQTVTVSGWVRIENAASASMGLTVRQVDGSGTNYHSISWSTGYDDTWTLLSGSFTLSVNGTLTGLTMYFEGPGSGVNFFVDDAELLVPGGTSSQATGEVDVNTRHQMIEGFGAAGAWYTSTLVNHPDSTLLYDLLFNQLSLDIYRIRNTYQIESGTLADSIEIIQQGESALGRPLKVMISSWSPPASLKSNDNTREGTLKDDGAGSYMYPEFADWWADSLDYFQSQGITADYINIQNEPDYTNPGWDTCELAPTETASVAGYDAAFEAVWAELNSRMGSGMPKMLASEATGFSNIGTYIDNLDNLAHVYGYAHHLYNCSNGGEPGCGEDPDMYISNMTNFAAQYNDKPRFQTEYEYLADSWVDAMNTALLLHNALTAEEVTAYVYWDLFWGSTSGSGLISITSSSYTINPVYYGFKHFSAFIDSGWQRVEVSDDSPELRVSAYISPDEQQLSVVLINMSTDTDIETDLTFTGFSIASGDIYQSSLSEDCIVVGTYNGSGPVTVPANSIITLSLSGGDDTTAPGAPAGLSAMAGDGIVSLNWDDNSEGDLAGYNVYRSTTSGSGYSQVNGSLLASSAYADNSVTNDITYYYVVTAVDTSANESADSSEVSATPAIDPPTVTPWLHADGNMIKDPAGNVVVLRGVDTIDLGFLEDWQGGVLNMIDRLTDKTDTQGTSPGWYPRVLRLAIVPADAADGWPHPFDPGNDDFYNTILRPAVDYCAEKDLYAIIDWHYVANTYEHVETTSAFWQYMAPRFASDSHVIFELFNEPINDIDSDWIFNDNDLNDWLSVRTDMQTWIDIVRTYAPNNLILVAGPFYSQAIGP
ncbi:MAG: carbohydrate binding domain-containing protein, partial [Sedimentisphaerales bacterium]|nr:carbohydrate binding domain-containing protein [Sedimentisphaerales bacterium]